MKHTQILALLLAVAMLFLASCGEENTDSSNDKTDSQTTANISSTANSDEDFFGDAIGELPDENISSNKASGASSNESSSNSAQNVSSTNKPINYIDHEFKYLQNFYSKITTKEYVTVSFIGGSVTDGMGATNAKEHGWPELVCKYLQDKFDTSVDIRKKSLGGTGSYLGAFKYVTDTAPSVYTQPDLLFIEFAINDHYIYSDEYKNNADAQKVVYDKVVKNSESIIRTAYRLNPEVDIIYVLTFDRNTKDDNYIELKAHTDVAKKYGLMCIKLADDFYSKLNSRKDDVNYIPDGVHPNNDGYRMYADNVIENIAMDLPRTGVAKPNVVAKQLPEPMSNYYKNPYLINSNEINMSGSNGWEFEKSSFSWVGTRFGGLVKSETPGSKLIVEFEGNHLGLLINRDKGMGKISVSVDGGTPVIVDAYRSSSNPSALPIAENLSNGKHTAEIILIDKTFEIGGLLVNKE